MRVNYHLAESWWSGWCCQPWGQGPASTWWLTMASGTRQLGSTANGTVWTMSQLRAHCEVAVPTNGQAEVMPIRSGLGISLPGLVNSQQPWLESCKPLWTSLDCNTVRIGWRRLLQAGGFLQHLAVAGTSNSNRGVALYEVVNKNLAPSNTSLQIQILVYRWIYPFFWAILILSWGIATSSDSPLAPWLKVGVQRQGGSNQAAMDQLRSQQRLFYHVSKCFISSFFFGQEWLRDASMLCFLLAYMMHPSN